MSKAIQIRSAILGLIGIGLIGFAVMGAGPVALASYSAHLDRNASMYGDVEAKRKVGYDKNYAIVCPDYAAASKWERWTSLRGNAWCEDYLNLLPEVAQN